MPESILITGGAGFIGSNLAAVLAASGCRIRVFDSLSPQIHGDARNSPTYLKTASCAEVIRGDVRDRDALARALDGVDAVVHLAAETGTGQSMYEAARYADVNVVGTGNLLDLLTASGRVSRIVVASSRAIYGEGKYQCDVHGVAFPDQRREADLREGRFDPLCPQCGNPLRPIPTDEESRLQPASVYGITKLTQEQMILLCGSGSGIPAIALRYQNVYGPGQSLRNPYTGILSIFSTRFRTGGAVNIFEDGLESRDFVYIDDVVAATVAALNAPATITGAFNIGSGRPIDVLAVARTLKAHLSCGGDIGVTGNFRIGDIRHNFADIERARKLLNWQPLVHFEDGLRRFVAWVQHQETSQDSYEHSLDELRSRGMLK